MFRFRLGAIPVQVHFSHFILSAVIANSFLPLAHDVGHGPVRELVDRSLPGSTQALLLYMVLGMAVVFVSVLVHELGHAVAALSFGYRPDIQIALLGGATRSNAHESVPWHKDLALTFAGPLFGALLGGLAFAAAYFLRGPALLLFGLKMAYSANFMWTVLNLLPVQPLDGGRMSTTLLQRIFGRPGFLAAQIGGLLTVAAIGALVFMGAGRDPILLLLLGMFGWRSVSLIRAYLKGDEPAPDQHHPTERAYAQALALYREGKLTDAKALSTKALGLEMAVKLRSRYQHLLGWVALKQGEGREALDHFSQVAGDDVEPPALAAAFSLVGDDARAVALWEKATKETDDATVRHEYAGTLLRLGREEEAKALPKIQLGAAYSCAERVLFMRKDYARAAEMGEKALAERPTASAAYDVACAWARAGKTDEAVAKLERAAELGFRDAEYAATDEDLSSLHRSAAFQSFLKRLRESAAS